MKKYSFEDLVKIKDIDTFVDDLSENEINHLKSLIDQWTEQELDIAKNILSDYYGMIVPLPLLREVVKKDLIMAYEIYTEGVQDTDQRDQLCDLVLKHIGVPRWPMYRDTSEYKKNFKKLLKEKTKEYSIQIDLDEDDLE